MTLKRKKRFFNSNSFWCQLHGIWYDSVNNINGSFVRYSNKRVVDLRRNNLIVDLKKVRFKHGW